MSQLFALDAQKAGVNRHVDAQADGLGITVHTDAGPVSARNVNDAIRVARDYMGEYLKSAQRPGVPWGLRVTVSGGVAVYGEWPLSGGGGGDVTFQNTPLVRIRNRWEGSGPLSALENAVAIIRAYAPSASRRAA